MSKIVDQPENYFNELIPARDELLLELLLELEAEAGRESIPIVGPVVGELLFILAGAMKAQSILEIGTATGYSAIYLARGCASAKGRVITLEFDSSKAARARKNFEKAGLGQRVEVRVGDALETLSRLDDEFDLVFIDIEKKDYAKVLPDCRRLLRQGGLLVADNVAFKDADEFNRTISDHPDWRSVSLFSYLPLHSPENDGLCLALRV
jgi:predicted O-methyltransferase YrrM